MSKRTSATGRSEPGGDSLSEDEPRIDHEDVIVVARYDHFKLSPEWRFTPKLVTRNREVAERECSRLNKIEIERGGDSVYFTQEARLPTGSGEALRVSRGAENADAQ